MNIRSGNFGTTVTVQSSAPVALVPALAKPVNTKLSDREFLIGYNIAQGETIKRQNDAIAENVALLKKAISVDESNYKVSYNPAKEIEGVAYPPEVISAKNVYEGLIAEAQRLGTDLGAWAAYFKTEAEKAANARNTTAMNLHVARINEVGPYGNRIAVYAKDITKIYSDFLDKVQAQANKYAEAQALAEAKKLVAEAEAARKIAEELNAKYESLEKSGNAVQAQVVKQQAEQLTAITDQAQAEAKSPSKGKLGLALAVGAGVLAILASQ